MPELSYREGVRDALSQASVRKSSYMTSTTGRIP